ncbi:HNH endonuclease [Pseudoxanthomonas japonensis]
MKALYDNTPLRPNPSQPRKDRQPVTASCYLCSKTFNNSDVLRHGEHVLQNAIGGALICDDILCEACGGRLGTSVDGAFAEAIAPLTALLQTPRDRGSQAQAKVQLRTSDPNAKELESIGFLLKNDFTVVPTRPVMVPDHSAKVARIVASSLQQANQFKRSRPIQDLLTRGYTVEVSDNAAAYAERLLLTARPGAPEILRGILKIAIGFASLHGVQRRYLAHLMSHTDLTTSPSQLRSLIIPYYPVDDVERLFETEKHVHEDWYPTHHVYLFSHGRDLYCYVELFGVLQNYVHLSDAYDGPQLIEKFVQKAEKWHFNENAFIARSPSDLDILAKEFGVPQNQTWEQIQAQVLHRAASRSYRLEPDETIEKVQALALLLAQYARLPNPEGFECVREMFAKAEAAKTQLGLRLLDDLKANPLHVVNLLNKNYSEFRIGNPRASRPAQAFQVSAPDVERYVSYKFYELLRAKGREAELEYQLL